MAFLDVVGELFGYASKGWTLEVHEDDHPQFKGAIKFQGDFPPQNMVESIGSNLGETSTIGKEQPNFQWLNGEAEVFTFTARIFARDSFKNIRSEIELLKVYARRNSTLKRAPIMLFTVGNEIQFTCFVRGVRFMHDEIRSDGQLRGAVCEITLQKLAEIQLGTNGPSLASMIKAGIGVAAAAVGITQTIGKLVHIPGGSLHTINRKYTAKYGDTFESIAKSEYGNPQLGDILRRVQPEKEPLTAGTEVLLVDPAEIVQIKVTQQAVALKNTPKNLTLRAQTIAARNRKTTIVV